MWDFRYGELIKYKDRFRDCNVPHQWAENKQLSTWVTVQRKNYKKGILSVDHIKRLEEIGFVWNPIDSQWEAMFIALKAYKAKHGDCNVSKEKTENKQLGRWVGTQRGGYQKGKLSEDHIKRLEEIGFVWNTIDSQWEEMFIALKAYKDKHGDCNVPSQWAENKQLGVWVTWQRGSCQKEKLNEDRIKRLEEIRFVWNPIGSQWEEMFIMLKEYKDKHGDCNVPLRWAENMKLGKWVVSQRGSFQKGKLDKDRIKRLEDIGFDWNPIDSQWEEMFIALKAYKAKHGDCNVPLQCAENKQLSTWVMVQRTNYKKEKLSEVRIERFEGIGFVWNPIDSQWEEMFIALKAYKDKHGDCNVPNLWAENTRLGVWIGRQCGSYRKGKLSEDRIKLLEDIGFEWERLDSKWEEMFAMLKKYKDRHGNCNVPNRWAENKPLGVWVGTQRWCYQKGRLSEDRIKRLEDIGFEWEKFDSKWEEMFIVLKAYKDKHGDCNVPQQWAESKQLGMWAGTQRKNYQKVILSEDRIKRLEEIGFVWDPIDSQWEEMFIALTEYKDKHGDCNVPLRWAENKPFGRWVGTQRGAYQKGKLSEDHIKRLEDIGFQWERFDSKWEEMFAMLKKYKDRHGDCNVSSRSEENKQLARWVVGQRANYKRGKLSKNRIKRLEEMGFVWKLPR